MCCDKTNLSFGIKKIPSIVNLSLNLVVSFEESSKFIELDEGFDFYAPQTFEDEQHRRILWAWMGLGDTSPEYSNPTVARGWQHAATVPRELHVRNQQLIQAPLAELQQLRDEPKKGILQLTVEGSEIAIEELKFELQLEACPSIEHLTINLLQDTKIQYQNGVLSLKHGVSGYGRKSRSIAVESLEQIQILVDSSSIELFINRGEKCLTSRVYPKKRDVVKVSGIGQVDFSWWSLS